MRFLGILLVLSFLTNSLTSCRKTRGCTDPEALNYNKDASKDDHSCYYYWIGQSYGGGKVFYIDQTKKHGLIACPFDLPSTPWGCISPAISVNTSTDVGTGLSNTEAIVAAYTTISAASICYNLDTLGFNDWYLPSTQELVGLDKTLGVMAEANLGSGYYWSSSQSDTNAAWSVMMDNGSPVIFNKCSAYSVRPIRSF